jgi:hypothetical protein
MFGDFKSDLGMLMSIQDIISHWQHFDHVTGFTFLYHS